MAAHNEAENLKDLLPTLLRQKYDHYEIILALDRCTDHSFEVADSFSDKRIRILEINQGPEDYNGKKYAISKAIHQATYEWILLTDADCRPASQNWIRCFNSKTSPRAQIILGLGAYTGSSGVLNALIRYETFQTALNYVSSAISGNPYMGVGRNLAYKKTLFLDTGGFGNFKHVTGGDDDLFVQSHADSTNTRLVLNPEGLTYSSPKRTWREYLQQKTRHMSVGKYYRSELKRSHFLNMTIHLVLWLSFLYLIFNYSDLWRIIGVFSLLLMVKGLFFIRIAKKTGIVYSVLWFPVVDFLFAVLMPLVGTRAVFVKNIKWN